MLYGMLADLATKTRAPLFDSPANWDLSFENVEFETSDGVMLRGWLVNPGKDKVIIQNHFGLMCSHAGYTNEGKPRMLQGWPTDVPFLRHIQRFAQDGYTVLAYDLRNHGASDAGPSPYAWDGQAEYQDVLAAVGFITSHPDYKDAPIGMLNFCMSSSAATLAHGVEGGLETVANIKAHVVLQPLYSGAWFRQMRIPGFMIRGAIRKSLGRGGPDFDKSPLDQVRLFNKPTMVIQNKNDPMADMEYVQAYFDALSVEKEMVWTDVGKSRVAGYADLGEHPEKALEWFNRFVPDSEIARPAMTSS
ncbi:MAG: alpha/beta fold hydrolase [Pseudomonadota bacterium]